MRFFLATVLLLTVSVAAESQVRVWEADVVIPTYPLAAAVARFEKSIASRDSDQTRYRDLGRVRLERGRPSDAIALLSGMAGMAAWKLEDARGPM